MASVVIVAVLIVAVSSVAVVYAAATRASNGADAAALGAAVATYPPAADRPPTAVANELADLNGSRLISCRCPIDGGLTVRAVEVVVAVDVDVLIFGNVTVQRTSRAEFDPRSWLGR